MTFYQRFRNLDCIQGSPLPHIISHDPEKQVIFTIWDSPDPPYEDPVLVGRMGDRRWVSTGTLGIDQDHTGGPGQ